MAAQGVIFLEDFVAFEGGQLTELEPDDGLGLGLGELVDIGSANLSGEGRKSLRSDRPFEDRCGHFHRLQADFRFGPIRRPADDPDYLVEGGDGNQLPFEHVAPPLRFAEQVLRSPADDLDPVVQEFLHHLFQ